MLIFGLMDQDQYLSAFGEVLLYIIAGILFILATLFVSRLIRPDRPNPEKLSTYESGEETCQFCLESIQCSILCGSVDFPVV